MTLLYLPLHVPWCAISKERVELLDWGGGICCTIDVQLKSLSPFTALSNPHPMSQKWNLTQSTRSWPWTLRHSHSASPALEWWLSGEQSKGRKDRLPLFPVRTVPERTSELCRTRPEISPLTVFLSFHFLLPQSLTSLPWEHFLNRSLIHKSHLRVSFWNTWSKFRHISNWLNIAKLLFKWTELVVALTCRGMWVAKSPYHL